MRKNFLLLFFIACISQMGHTQSGKSLLPANFAAKWIAVLNQQNVLSLLDFYEDSIKMESPNWEGVKIGKVAVTDTYTRYFAGTPDMKFTLTNIVAGANSIVLEYRSEGTFTNPEKGTPDYMKGKKYALKHITRFDFNNGKIANQVSYFDQVAFLRQMGFFDQK